MMRILHIVLVTLLALLPLGVAAHSVSTAHVFVEELEEGRYRLELDLPIVDVALALPLDSNLDEQVTWGEALALREDLLGLGASGIGMQRGGSPCRLHRDGIATRRYGDKGYLTLRYRATCGAAGPLRMSYSVFAESDPDHRALVRVRGGGQESLYLAGGNQGMLDMPVKAHASSFKQFFFEGIRHLMIGYDHLAFLIALLLPAGLSAAGGKWRPSESFRTSLLHSATLATCFTLAHSLTLAAAVMEWVQPDGKWIEAAIAASIIVAALANLRPSLATRGWVLAFAFGLIHGFGFAGALAELGLPPDARTWALLAFNLGVEAGQLAVVAIVLPPLFLLGRTNAYRRIGLPVLSLGTAMIGAYWLFDRV